MSSVSYLKIEVLQVVVGDVYDYIKTLLDFARL